MLKRNELSSHEKDLKGNLNAYYKVKEASVKVIYCMPLNHTTFWIRQNYGDNQKICGCQWRPGREGGREGGMNEWTTDFGGSETIPHDTVIMVDLCH